MNANITPFLEKTIRGLTEYEIYWFLIQLRNSYGCPIDLIETEPKYLKEKIFNYVESHKISDSRIKKLKKNMLEEMLPLNTVSWFYKKDRETLFILMILKENNSNTTSIRNKEDIKKLQ